jgi:hypothetical protein
MSRNEKFTGKMHTHDPVVLSVTNQKQAERLVAMLDMIDEHARQTPSTGLVIIGVSEDIGARVILCRGCLEEARQALLSAADTMRDLIAHPTVEEAERERTHGQK